MKNNGMGRRSFLGRSVIGAAGACVLAGGVTSGAAAAPAGAKLRKAVQLGMLPKELPDAEKFALAKRCG